MRTELIIASDPDVGCIGKILSVLKGIPFVYYPFELYGEEYSRSQNLTTSFWMWAEKMLLRSSIDLLVTQNEERASVYTNDRGATIRPLIIRNYKPRVTVSATGTLRRRIAVSDGQRIVLYQGALRPGRCLEQLVEAATMIADDAVLVLLGHDSAYARQYLYPIIGQHDLSNKVFLVPGVAADALPPLVADADVGVVIYEGVGRNNLFCAPGKLSDYVNASVPVVVPPFPPMRSLLVAHQFGVCYETCSPLSIALAINRVLAIPKAEWRDRMRSVQSEMIWETQEPLFVSAITRLIPGSA
jgi:glycosyltransferase involved in cell wall biosynthesis